ncbi:MAG: nitronate monooxygenase [Planctomycetota bacterium]|jgi:nitronate monooxygenase
MEKISTKLTTLLKLDYPIIMAPMFLVTNEKMMIQAMNMGIGACIPALNWRTDDQMRAGIAEIKSKATKGALGINLIVNKSNPKYIKQLDTCIEVGVDFIITSLGNPQEVIDKCKGTNTKVLCDVVDEKFAKKVELLGADAIIAVNKEAGGHSGSMLSSDLIPLLKKSVKIPVVSAGGVGNGKGFYNRLNLEGADGCSIGSIFIATTESNVSEAYKNACVEYSDKDIVMSTKISGTPATVINTPYVRKIGTKQGWLEKLLSKNKLLKKWIKMFTFLKGMKAIEKAANGATYKTVWIAGPTIKFTTKIKPVQEVIQEIIEGFQRENNQKKAMSRSVSRK